MSAISKKDMEAQQQGFQDRVDGFMKEYKTLTEKWDIDYVQFPQFLPNEKGEFVVIIQNMPKDLKLQKLNDSFISK